MSAREKLKALRNRGNAPGAVPEKKPLGPAWTEAREKVARLFVDRSLGFIGFSMNYEIAPGDGVNGAVHPVVTIRGPLAINGEKVLDENAGVVLVLVLDYVGGYSLEYVESADRKLFSSAIGAILPAVFARISSRVESVVSEADRDAYRVSADVKFSDNGLYLATSVLRSGKRLTRTEPLTEAEIAESRDFIATAVDMQRSETEFVAGIVDLFADL